LCCDLRHCSQSVFGSGRALTLYKLDMQFRLFRHFVPVSVLLLVSSDTPLIAGTFYQLLSESQAGPPIAFAGQGAWH
jgi:hypothetical protein